MKLPAMVDVKSSNIAKLGHDSRGLFVQFVGGGIYHYPEAPREIFNDLVGADSVGKAFGAKVKGVFVHRQVRDVEPHNR